jgi:hypothetical protein
VEESSPAITVKVSVNTIACIPQTITRYIRNGIALREFRVLSKKIARMDIREVNTIPNQLRKNSATNGNKLKNILLIKYARFTRNSFSFVVPVIEARYRIMGMKNFGKCVS